MYLVLHDFFREILDTAQTRPLDYEFLRTLPPGPQRLYELLSYYMFGALKHGGRARMRYSEFCTYAPQVRYRTLGEVRKQMDRLHAPHHKAGYIADVEVEYQATTDRDGQPDWMMIYVPGPRAKAEFKAFTGKGGPVAPQVELPLTGVEIEPEPEPTGLEAELVARGITRSVASELVRGYPEDRIRAQIERLDWLREKRPKRVKDVGAYLADAIRKDYAAPAGFEAETKRAERAAADQEREAEIRKAQARARADRDRVQAFWEGLSPEEQARLEAEALEQADPEVRANCERGPLPVRRMALAAIREAHIRALLDLPLIS